MLFLQKRIEERRERENYRSLKISNENAFDFLSNDYLSLARDREHEDSILQEIKKLNLSHGSTGSRLLSGNNTYAQELETLLSEVFQSESALLFNSGYDANLGLISAIASREDIIIHDEYVHASLRDGISLSRAKAWSFDHNDPKALEEKLILAHKQKRNGEVFIAIESLYSMDGDIPDLTVFTKLAEDYGAHLIVDEAHAAGVYGKGFGVEQNSGQHVFARIITFGKAFGAHGAAILGSKTLKEYLVNFSRSLIYSTALAPSSLAAIRIAVRKLRDGSLESRQKKLFENINYFQEKQQAIKLPEATYWLPSASPVQSLVFSSAKATKTAALTFQENGFDIRPVLSPTVPVGKERLRIVLHTHNNQNEINSLFQTLKNITTIF